MDHTQNRTARITAISVIVFVAALLSRSSPMWAQGAGQPSVLTRHNDNSRTGANLNETILNTSNVNVNQFGKLFSRSVDGQVYAQPLYVPGVTIGLGVHNVVYVATMTNNVYAFDADDPSASTPLWQVNLGPPVPVADTGEAGDINPLIGITSTPVIDSASGILYCVAKTKEGTSYVQRLHALDIASGQETLGGPAVIDASVLGTGDDSVGGSVRFNPLRELNRPGLLLSNGYLYMMFGSHGDNRPYHGWVLSYDAASLQRVGTFNVTPNGWGGAIWESGQGLAADDHGYLYFITGNGTFNLNTGGQDCSSCFVKLGPPTLNLVDWFAPYDQNNLNSNNFDLNSSGPLLVPGTNLVVGGGKSGVLYVLDHSNMGHFQAGSNSQIVQSLQVTYGDPLHGSPVYWVSPQQGALVFVWYENDYLKAFNLVNGRFQNNIDPNTGLSKPIATSTMATADEGGMLSISANGSATGTGVVWATNMPGILRAFDASNVSIELWNSQQNAARDDLGTVAKFTPPTIANGKVYQATFSNQLVVYGLLGTSAPPPTVGSVSPASGPTTGGTAVTITGANFVSGATVSLGGNAATGVSVVNSTTITATTPAHAAGAVNVTVTNPDAQSGTLASGFTYTASAPAPTISTVSPASGPTSGGTSVTITGTNFASGATVSVGGSAATGVSVVNSTTITATTPAHAAGAVNVTVTNPDTQSGTLANGFTYTASRTAPTVGSVSPASGPTTGGMAVTITGTNFVADAPIVADVFIDMNVANAVGTTLSPTIMGNGTQGVYNAPWEESPEPPTGFTVGAHLHDRRGSVQIGSTVYPPNHTSKSLALDHAYNSRVEHINLPVGHAALTIAGFVTFGPPDAGSSSHLFDYWEIQGRISGDFAVLQLDNGRGAGVGYGVAIESNPGGVTTHSPFIAITPGATYWCVLKSDFISGIARLALYEITNWSLVGSVTSSQSAGSESIGWINIGNNEIGLAPGTTSYFENMVIDYTSAAFPLGPGSPANTAVSFGGSAATNVNVVDSGTITATTPGHAAGAVNVSVTNPDGQSGTLASGFTYTASAAPTVGSVAPGSGPTTGGTAVTISGTNFAAGATVTVGGTAATGVSVVSSTTITATTPAHAAGAVNVTVTNADGQSGTLPSRFTYTAAPPTPIGFVQVAEATPQTPSATVSATYTSSETPGDLNIVAIGWNDTTATVQSVRDSAGNVYNLAIGPTSGTGLRQSIYYATNIVGGTDTVTATFSQPAVYPDLRILEYTGVSALDVTAGASGSGTTSNSGSATTTAANELIFGANMVSTYTKAAGNGFTARTITHIDNDIAEDMIVTATGTYSATALLGMSGDWVMVMATFKTASAPAPTPAPTVSSVAPSSGPTTGGTAVTITGANFLSGATVSFGASAATGVSVVNSTTITATTPAHAAGAVSLTVTNPDAQNGTLANGFTYLGPAPTVSSVTPTSGPATGGTTVIITGTNFAAGATVTVGGSAATGVTVVNSTTITATTPAHAAGAVSVTVTNPDSQSGTLPSGFTYTAGAIGFAKLAATPQSPSGTAQVTNSGSQTAADLKIVIVG